MTAYANHRARCDFADCRAPATHVALHRNTAGELLEIRPLCRRHALGKGFAACHAGATVEPLVAVVPARP